MQTSMRQVQVAIVVSVVSLVLLLSGTLLAQPAQPSAPPAQPSGEGVVSGTLKDKTTGELLGFANITLIDKADTSLVRAVATDKDGKFVFTGVPAGDYLIQCSYIGHETYRSSYFTIGAGRLRMDLKPIAMIESAFALDEVSVTTEKKVFNYSIDRKVYNVDQDMMSKSGSASEILQNIPSVQVDINGNVSLRGSPSVLILVNGKASPVMKRSQADVLQQMPASGIEKIEVITNPSARFSPEGTSGIINIVMKKDTKRGMNGSVTVHGGTVGRHNENMAFNYNPGKFNLFGNYGYRHEHRSFFGTDTRQEASVTPGFGTSSRQDEHMSMHPDVYMGSVGLNYHPSEANTFELSGQYFKRYPIRHGTVTVVDRDSANVVIRDYDRIETGHENESQQDLTAAYEHDFPKEDHKLRIEATGTGSPELEINHFTNIYRTPGAPRGFDNSRANQKEQQGQLTIDYTNPLSKISKLEAGYAGELDRVDVDAYAETFDAVQDRFIEDPGKTYHFKVDQLVHALYSTLEHSLGDLSFMGGLRVEHATVKPKMVSKDSTITTNYLGVYPTFHLAYKLSESGELQLNYSRRINRPEIDELNPFPRYEDPRDVEVGNPHLKPENIHSVELGYQWRTKAVTLVPSVFYRYKYNGFTRVAQALNDTTLLRTMKNLASDQSGGIEAVASTSVGNFLTANLNGNAFYEEIDASNIGYSAKKSIVSYSGTANLNINPSKATMFQVNSNFRSGRLTPQGKVRPSWGLNVGVRQDLFKEKVSLTLTVSDVFKTQKQDLRLDLGGIKQHMIFRRDARIAYFGITYHFGLADKKAKEKTLQYDEGGGGGNGG
jgi:outer membrane receptor protein involved in Fe transport